jgi:hypothetical protein
MRCPERGQAMSAGEVVAAGGRLDEAEATRLGELESVIERGRQTFLEVGLALEEIRKKRLYRAEFATFRDYCAARWDFTDRWARQLIDSAAVVSNLKQSGTMVPLPSSKRQIRPLIGLPAPEQAEAWTAAVAEAPDCRPTGAQVQAAVERITGGKSRQSDATATAPPRPEDDDTDPGTEDPEGTDADGDDGWVEEPGSGDFEPEPPKTEAELEEEYLKSLPLSAQLTGSALQTFRQDALRHRALWELRRKIGEFMKAHPASTAPGVGTGGWTAKTLTWLKLEGPERWHLCAGCRGSGTANNGVLCDVCRGDGYHVPQSNMWYWQRRRRRH